MKEKQICLGVCVFFIPKLFQSRYFNMYIIGTRSRHTRKEWKLWSLRQPKTCYVIAATMMMMIRKENNSKNKWKHIIQQIKSTTKSRVHILFFICHSQCATLCIKRQKRERERKSPVWYTHQIKWEKMKKKSSTKRKIYEMTHYLKRKEWKMP